MIPIFFDDPMLPSGRERMSQMFVSNMAGQSSNEREKSFTTCTHDSIACSSPLPFIALLLDLDGKRKLDVTFPQEQSNHPETDRCLRIYASGLNKKTFPFLSSVPVAELLQGLISKPKEPISSACLQARLKFGSTIDESHRDMQWEEQGQTIK